MANAASRGWFHKKGRDESAPPAADVVDTQNSPDVHFPTAPLAAFDAIVGARLSSVSPENGSHSTETGTFDTIQVDAALAVTTTEPIDDEKEAVFHVKQSADEASAPTSVPSAEDEVAVRPIDWDAATHAAMTEDAATTAPAVHAPLAEEVATLTRRRQAIAELRRAPTIASKAARGAVGEWTSGEFWLSTASAAGGADSSRPFLWNHPRLAAFAICYPFLCRCSPESADDGAQEPRERPQHASCAATGDQESTNPL
jgi:hypothetical protein